MGTNAIMTAEKGFPLKFVFALESLFFYKRLRHCEASPLVIASEAKQSAHTPPQTTYQQAQIVDVQKHSGDNQQAEEG